MQRRAIYFGEARITSPINEFLKQANLSLINKSIPFDASEQGGPISGLYVAEVQVTIFACGWPCHLCMSFTLFGDGTTLGSFLEIGLLQFAKMMKE